MSPTGCHALIPWDLTKLDNLTLGLGRHAARNLHKPVTSMQLATTSSGLPHGMTLSAGAGREGRLLGLSLELEEAVGWPRIQAV
jgi:Asp-tRNA(Asn)/Glu-tRNA(Gln) amidotransferase A subunit family amidase